MELTNITDNTGVTTADADGDAQARRARFGKLPEPVPYSAMVEEQPATPKAGDGYDAERSWLHHSCVALDLGF
jgi:hypothetical protein